MNSDEYDEYLIMKQLIAFYEQNWGFFKDQISAIVDETTAKAFLKKARAYAGKLQFPSTLYNSGQIEDVPIFVKPDELVLFITPDVQASIDVDALAVLFNVDRAEVSYRTVIIDEFPIPNAQALLTTEDFFMCKDTEYETTSAYNPKTLGQNYFLHHWGIYSVSPFVPAILFTTDASTTVPTVTQAVTGIEMAIKDAAGSDIRELAAGKNAYIELNLTGTVDPAGYFDVQPDSAMFEVSVVSDGAAVNSPRTRVSSDNVPNGFMGVLHLAKTLPEGAVVTVNATATYVNPSGATQTFTATDTVTVPTSN